MAPIFEKFTGDDGSYYFRLIAASGKQVLISPAYHSEQDCDNSILFVRINSPYDLRYERRKAGKDEYFFCLIGGAGKPIGTSVMFKESRTMEDAITVVKCTAPKAPIVDRIKKAKAYR
jgi:uncharacterized protein YegP (UPF0339 family)